MINIALDETSIAFVTAIIGIISLILASRARAKLSVGTLKDYVNYYMTALLLLLAFALWKIIQSVFNLRSFEFIYTEYTFLAFTFIVFALTTRKMFMMSKEFGFSEKTKKIEKILKQRKLRR